MTSLALPIQANDDHNEYQDDFSDINYFYDIYYLYDLYDTLVFINPLSSLSNSLKASFNSDFCSIDITEVLLIVMLKWCWNEKLCYSKKTMLEIISSYSEEIQNALSAYHNIRSNVTSSSTSFEVNSLTD